MKRYLSLMTFHTKVRCAGVGLLALSGYLVDSAWPVRLEELYNSICNGTSDSLVQGAAAVGPFGPICFSEGCSILQWVALGNIGLINGADAREKFWKISLIVCCVLLRLLEGRENSQAKPGNG